MQQIISQRQAEAPVYEQRETAILLRRAQNLLSVNTPEIFFSILSYFQEHHFC